MSGPREAGPRAGVCGQALPCQAVPVPTPKCPHPGAKGLGGGLSPSPPRRSGLDSGRTLLGLGAVPEQAKLSHLRTFAESHTASKCKTSSAKLQTTTSGEFQRIQGASSWASQESHHPWARAHTCLSRNLPISSKSGITHTLFALLHFQGRERCPKRKKNCVDFLLH